MVVVSAAAVGVGLGALGFGGGFGFGFFGFGFCLVFGLCLRLFFGLGSFLCLLGLLGPVLGPGLSAAAARLGVSRTHLREVINGNRQSKHLMARLAKAGVKVEVA